MSTKIQRVRGTRDLLPEESVKFRFVEQAAYRTASLYGYGEIETPMFEFSDVFHRTLGETSDVVNKETYTFLDRGGESLTLRPEGTAGVARAFVSEGLAQNLPLKFYYSGPMFRYERPQKGRYRQFKQVGVEHLGLESPLADVECLAAAWDFLGDLGISTKCHLEINTLGDNESRAQYRDALVKYFQQFENQLSADSKMRLEKNPLRILDSKDEGDRKLIVNAPLLKDHLNETSQKFFADVLEGIESLGIPYQVNDKLVRGLDYYCHSVFEFVTTELGAQGSVLAGGRYDGLIEMMGGPKTPGVGWAAGMDRLVDLLDPSRTASDSPLLAIIPADSIGEKAALLAAHELRQHGLRTELLLSGKMAKRFQKADKMNASHALVLGENEVTSQQIAVKDLKLGTQENLTLGDLIKKLNKHSDLA
jgi:histidyl-tRNA synthetase